MLGLAARFRLTNRTNWFDDAEAEASLRFAELLGPRDDASAELARKRAWLFFPSDDLLTVRRNACRAVFAESKNKLLLTTEHEDDPRLLSLIESGEPDLIHTRNGLTWQMESPDGFAARFDFGTSDFLGYCRTLRRYPPGHARIIATRFAGDHAGQFELELFDGVVACVVLQRSVGDRAWKLLTETGVGGRGYTREGQDAAPLRDLLAFADELDAGTLAI